MADVRATTPVYLFRPSDKTPVFHFGGAYEFDQSEMSLGADHDERRNEYRTRCGLVISQHHWVQLNRSPWTTWTLHQYDARPVHLRFDNASLIGRPCARCFPTPEPKEGTNG